MRDRRLILAIFILSGAAGLMYEIVWSRQLVLVFGNTTQAVSTILTGFFGGMAVGSYFGGKVADRVRSPLRLYGVIEVVLVFIVLATPLTFRLIHEVYRGFYGSLEGQPMVLALLRFALAILALAPATILMGATLPTLTRYLTGGGHLSAAFGRLYAANTYGAIVGTLLAGVVLIELLGLTGTLVVAASLSGIAGIAAIAMSRAETGVRQEQIRLAPESTTDGGQSGESAGGRAQPNLALILAFVSGLTSLGYQVLWTRLLSSGTGNSTYVFTLILAVFLVGIALGAAGFAAFRHRIRSAAKVIALAQLAVAVLATAGLVLVIARPEVLDPNRPLESAAAALIPIVLVVLPTTYAIGLTLPATSVLLAGDERRIAVNAGRLLAANTAGAILATFAIPFFVIPAVGSPVAVALLALVNAGTALLLVIGAGARPRIPVGVGAAAVAVAIVGLLVAPGAIKDPSVVRIERSGAALFESREDEIASVQAGATRTPQLWVTGTAMTLLTIDAKLMPILPLIARPDAGSALTVAFGMGSAFRGAVIAGLETDAIELVPTVPEMFHYFYADAATILADPKGRVIVADGRNHMELTDRTYDMIVTDPPPPIESSGASVISSLEYYQAGHRRLNPGGVMMQWVPYGGTVEEFQAHIRTFDSVFEHVIVAFGSGGYGFYVMGSDAPMSLDEAAIREVLDRPGVLEDISKPAAYDSPESTVDGWVQHIPGMVWLVDEEVAAFTGDGPLITDDRPLPEYFLWRRVFGDSPRMSPEAVLEIAPR